MAGTAGTYTSITETFGRIDVGRITAIDLTIQLSTSADYWISHVYIQADPNNAASVFVGNATQQVIELEKGDTITIHIGDLRAVYVRFGTTGGYVNWLAVR